MINKIKYLTFEFKCDMIIADFQFCVCCQLLKYNRQRRLDISRPLPSQASEPVVVKLFILSW